MSCGIKAPLELCKGKTFDPVFRWGQDRYVYRTISAAPRAAPLVFTTATPHGMPDGWPYRIQGADGMEGINPTTGEQIGLNTKPGEYRTALVVDANNVEINGVDATDFTDYVANSAQLVYHLPVDMTGFTARMQVRESADAATTILDLTTANGGIVIDLTKSTVTIKVAAADSVALPEVKGVYELEMVSSGGEVTRLAYGTFEITAEVTR